MCIDSKTDVSQMKHLPVDENSLPLLARRVFNLKNEKHYPSGLITRRSPLFLRSGCAHVL